MSDSETPWMQHARLLSPPLSSRICSNSCPLNQWCYLTIFSSATRFSLCLQSLPASGSFPVSQFFETGWQSIEVSASASVLPMNIQGWVPLGLTGLISAVQGTLKSLLQHHSSKASSQTAWVQTLHLSLSVWPSTSCSVSSDFSSIRWQW